MTSTNNGKRIQYVKIVNGQVVIGFEESSKKRVRDMEDEEEEEDMETTKDRSQKFIIYESPYQNFESSPYAKNDGLPDVRIPKEKSVPEHLIKEFTHMMKQSEETFNRRKTSLNPNSSIPFRGLQVMTLCKSFTDNPKNLEELAKISLSKNKTFVQITSEKPITLSQINSLCVTYSLTYDVTYDVDGHAFNLRNSYDIMQKNWCKILLDPFARSYRGATLIQAPKIMLEVKVSDPNLIRFYELVVEPYKNKNGKESLDIYVETTSNIGFRKLGKDLFIYVFTSVGQINFFSWAIKNKVVDYCRANAEKIQQFEDNCKKQVKHIREQGINTSKRIRLINRKEDESAFSISKNPTRFDFSNLCNPIQNA